MCYALRVIYCLLEIRYDIPLYIISLSREFKVCMYTTIRKPYVFSYVTPGRVTAKSSGGAKVEEGLTEQNFPLSGHNKTGKQLRTAFASILFLVAIRPYLHAE